MYSKECVETFLKQQGQLFDEPVAETYEEAEEFLEECMAVVVKNIKEVKEYLDVRPALPKLITVFSWNEWIEGGYLLPDMKYGFGYLEAVKEVILDGKYDGYK